MNEFKVRAPIFACLLTLASGVFPAATAARQNAAPLSAFSQRKSEQLLRNRLPCLGCHQFGNSGGRLAPDLANVRTRRTPAYVAAMISDPQRTLPGTIMPKVPMSSETRELLVRYLTGSSADVGSVQAQPAPAGLPASSVELYVKFCAGCHGARGEGDGVNAKYLAVRPTRHVDSRLMSTRTDDRLFDTIAAGGYVMNLSNLMPAFGETLPRESILGLVRYLRTICKCEGPAWSRDNK